MTTFRLIIVFLLISPWTFAQETTLEPLKEKKLWEYPIQKPIRIETYEQRKNSSETNGSEYISFFSDESAPVYCVRDSKVFKIEKIDSIYVVMTSFDNHFLTYSGLTKPLLNKGDSIKAGQIIAHLKKDYDDRFCVDIYLSNPIKNLDPAPFFRK